MPGIFKRLYDWLLSLFWYVVLAILHAHFLTRRVSRVQGDRDGCDNDRPPERRQDISLESPSSKQLILAFALVLLDVTLTRCVQGGEFTIE